MLRNISRKYFSEEFQLSPNDVDDLIDEALSTLSKSIGDFEKLFADGTDKDGLKEVAHAMKGNLLNMGLSQQATIAMNIESNIDSDFGEAKEQFIELKKELEGF